MLDKTKQILRSARFFYRLMIEAEKGTIGAASPKLFSIFFNAFIQAARNVT